MTTRSIRKAVGLTIIAVIALLHVFSLANYLDGDWRSWYYSYFSDLILPFGMYFLLCIAEFNVTSLHQWYVKSGVIIGVTVLAEVLQYNGIYAFGTTFDPIDILMYVLGVGIAVVVDRLVFRSLIPQWDLGNN
ncbi:MAG: hypothetical protein JNL40_08155 [Cyclobacteriaceae bacterium]|nr:hypothetical protein [Cyclobacteriaceae bacterium]